MLRAASGFYDGRMSARVLIVDSDFTTRMRAIGALMGAGYEVSIAEDPVEAATLAANESPQLVLIGDSMARSSGLVLVGRLFSTAETAAVPVLVVADTAHGRLAADQAGARLVIPGPATDAELIAAVAAHVNAPGALPGAPRTVLEDDRRVAAVTALRTHPVAQHRLDRFTRLAAKILQVPVSTITLVDRNRQVYASQVGVAEPWASRGEVPLEYSYCQFAVASREPLRIDDAPRHPLVQNSPAISEMGVVAYLGIPLITADDQAVGSLCAIDSRPRQWTELEVSILNDLAEILADELDAPSRSGGRHSAA